MIRCREITTADLNGIVDLLTNGFRNRTRGHWLQALQRLSKHSTPPSFPKYGYLLECNGTPVGVSLHIYSSIPVNGEARIRCSLSSWYVHPAFRSHATMLTSHGRKHDEVTYFNVTPASNTLPILEAKGYVKYCRGWFAAVPALSLSPDGARVEVVAPDIYQDKDLQPFEKELLVAHADYGCISVVCHADNGTYPFVFKPRRKFGVIPFAYLLYCRDIADFVRFAGSLGRVLAKSGFPVVVLDSNGPIRGLVGKYIDARPKYFKGPHQPRLGDQAYSELAMFPIRDERIWNGWLRKFPRVDVRRPRVSHSG